MLLYILISLLVLLLLLIAVIATRPADFRVTRTATIAAPQSAVFAQVNDFHNWQAWSPWAKIDPAAKNSYEGAPAGTGANFKWDGNKKVGAGSMTITESRPSDLILIQLVFLRPFAATNTAEFTFKPQGDQTAVTWSMFGKSNFMAKAVGLFMNMDNLVGSEFAKGLANMKAIVETAPR